MRCLLFCSQLRGPWPAQGGERRAEGSAAPAREEAPHLSHVDNAEALPLRSGPAFSEDLALSQVCHPPAGRHPWTTHATACQGGRHRACLKEVILFHTNLISWTWNQE